MERAKGATAADRAAHVVFDTIRIYSGGRNYGGKCSNCGTALLTQYHEERLYSVHCPACGIVSLAQASNPAAAELKIAGLTGSDKEG